MSQSSSGTIGAWRAGAGAAILLVHGWGDTHRVWRRYFQTALGEGRAVVVMDLPGHGISDGQFTTFQNAGEAILAVSRAAGPIWSVVAHSFGCVATVRALGLGLGVEAAVLIAPPAGRADAHWSTKRRNEGVSETVIAEVEQLYEKRTGVSLAPFDMRPALKQWRGDLCLMASVNDTVTPLEPIRELASELPAATFFGTFASDHRDMPNDPEVIRTVTEYLRGPGPSL